MFFVALQHVHYGSGQNTCITSIKLGVFHLISKHWELGWKNEVKLTFLFFFN